MIWRVDFAGAAVLCLIFFGVATGRRLTRRQVPTATCDHSAAQSITGCLDPMLQLSQAVAEKEPSLNFITFPLYNFQPSDIDQICRSYQRLESSCLTEELRLKCAGHPLVTILESLFGYACDLKNFPAFSASFDCVHRTTIGNPVCVQMITGTGDPAQIRDKCAAIPDYFQCLHQRIETACGADALRILETTLKHFGCPVKWKQNTNATATNLPVIREPADQATKLPPPHSLEPTSEETAKPKTTEVPTTLAETSPSSGVGTTDTQQKITSTTSQQWTSKTMPETETTWIDTSPTSSATKPETPSTRLTEPPTIPTETWSTHRQTSADRSAERTSTTSKWTTGRTSSRWTNQPTSSGLNSPAEKFAISSETSPRVRLTVRPGEITCNDHNRLLIRSCLRHVVDQWHEYTLQDPSLMNTSFPLLKLKKHQLLELCDNYASSFLSCQLDLFHICRTDPVVHFADSMLGFACGNAAKFLESFDCIQKQLGENPSCMGNIQRANITEENVCKGMPEFHACIKTSLRLACNQEANDLLESAIGYFGCEL